MGLMPAPAAASIFFCSGLAKWVLKRIISNCHTEPLFCFSTLYFPLRSQGLRGFLFPESHSARLLKISLGCSWQPVLESTQIYEIEMPDRRRMAYGIGFHFAADLVLSGFSSLLQVLKFFCDVNAHRCQRFWQLFSVQKKSFDCGFSARRSIQINTSKMKSWTPRMFTPF